MTHLQRLLRRAGLLGAACLLIAAPMTSLAASRQRSKRSARSDRRVTTPRSNQRSERRRAALERAYAAKRRRAEAQRQAAIAHQRALDAAMRFEVQSMISRDEVTGEDEQVRRVAVNALGNHAGTVVVMDPKTGRIYTIVNQEWALRRGFKPCSTIKLVTGVAGLNEKVIDPVDTARVSGAYHINLTDALAYSNNTYFQQVGGRVGFDKMVSYARLLGLGQKTGINSPNEFAGSVPVFKSGFAVNRMSSHGDHFSVTAVQLATLVSAMANGGKLLAPYVPRSLQEEARLKSRVRRQLNIDPMALIHMVPGMVGAVNYGSGKRAYNSQETVVGKTGTCIGEGGWVGLFTSYAPLANPRLAVVVIAQGTDAHRHFPAAVAGQIYRELSGRFGTPTTLQIADRRDWIMESARPDPKAALLNEEDSETTTLEANTENEASVNSANVVAKTDAPKVIPADASLPVKPINNKVRLVLMPIPGQNRKPVRSITVLNGGPKPAADAGQRPRRVTTIQP